MRWLMIALLMTFAFGSVGCGSGGDGPEADQSAGDSATSAADGQTPDATAPDDAVIRDPDVAPITAGDWYRPSLNTTWQWQLLGDKINSSYNVALYDVDLFDQSSEQIAGLQGAGRKVICYFSAGSSEDWRLDFTRFAPGEMGMPLDGWQGERWLDVRSPNVWSIMIDRLDLARAKGCDGVEPDNVDGYANHTGFPLSAADQLAYNRHLANAAHERGLAIGLKNNGAQAALLVSYYDFSLNEQCHRFDECDQLAVFTAAAKPIFNAEYTDANTLQAAETLAKTLCPAAVAANIRTLILPLNLDDAFRVSCD